MAAVSVIVPVYNAEAYIDRCISSIANQSFSDIEIIIINDGSTDNSEQHCLDWQNRDNRITYVSKKNEGAGPTRTLGIQMASTEFVAFCDSDDWYDEKFVELMVAKQFETGADIVTCGRYKYDGINDDVVGTIVPLARDVHVGYWTCWQWKLVNSLCVKLLRKSLFIEHGIKIPEGHGEDTAIQYFLLTVANNVAVIEKPLYYYWYNREGSSVNSAISHTSCTVKYMTYCWDMFAKAGMFETYKKPLLLEAYSIIGNWYLKIKENVEYSRNWLLDCAKAIESYFDDISTGISVASPKRIIGYGALGKSATKWLALLKGTPLYPTELWDIKGNTAEVTKPDFSSITDGDCLLCFPSNDIEEELREQFDNLDCKVLFNTDITQWYAYWMIKTTLCKGI